jgi:hypothetical protein
MRTNKLNIYSKILIIGLISALIGCAEFLNKPKPTTAVALRTWLPLKMEPEPILMEYIETSGPNGKVSMVNQELPLIAGAMYLSTSPEW